MKCLIIKKNNNNLLHNYDIFTPRNDIIMIKNTNVGGLGQRVTVILLAADLLQ